MTRQILRRALPVTLLLAIFRPAASRLQRGVAGTALVALWVAVYRGYRRAGKARTAWEREALQSVTWDAFTRHYNERVPTMEEEFDIWGRYHQHRHEMRYDLVAEEVRRHLRRGGRVLDVGAGAGLVADRLLDVPALYVGIDFTGRMVSHASAKFSRSSAVLHTVFSRGDAEGLPFADNSFDVLVMSEVIEHLLRPEKAVWEVARVLKPAGVYVMTTNNASEAPLRSPLSHMLAWLEKGLGATHPRLISARPWVWPETVDRALLPPGSGDVYLPHTHHIFGETRALLAAAGLETTAWSTFEFPPPQSATAAWLERREAAGRSVVDAIEAAARRIPLVNRMGCHLFVIARKERPPVAPSPPPGLWPGPFSRTPEAHSTSAP